MFLTSLLLINNTLRLLLPGWETDFQKAQQVAKQEHRYILLNFSGSDWCGPCIRLHHDIFEADAFKKMAESNLVLVNADFPRLKKNRLPKELQKQNEQLADRYDAKGVFPLTVLLSADGKVVKQWDGFPAVTPEQFASQVKAAMQ